MDASGRLGSYELLHRLAVGGMGEVFLARHRGLAGVARLVALKRMLPEHAEQAGAVELFLDEAKVAASLAHPNIVQVHELGNERGTYYIAMELVTGHSLDRIAARGLARHAPLDRSLAVHAVAEVLRGLAHAHGARDAHGAPLAIVHRDVSPHNVLVSYDGDVKLLDFGIARAANQSHRTRTGVVRGKPVYMAPERLTGETVDARADVYAAGVMLWELTLGRRLFEGEPELAIAQLIADGRIPAPRSIDPDYPEALEALVMAAVRPHRDERLADAATLGDGLYAYLAASRAGDLRSELGRVVRALFADEAKELEAIIRETAAPAAGSEPVDAAALTVPLVGPAVVIAPAEVARDSAAPAVVIAPAEVAERSAAPSRERAHRVRPAVALLAGAGLAGLAIAVAATRDAGRDRTSADAGVTEALAEGASAPGASTPRADGSIPTTPDASIASVSAPANDAGRPAPEAPRASRPAPPIGERPTDFATRLLPEALINLGARFAERCAGPGVVLPRAVTFELRVDKLGRVKEAALVGRGPLENPTTRCLWTWMMRQPFQLSERDASGTLTIRLPPSR